MIEKTSEDIKCKICGGPATKEVAGIPCCETCAQSKGIKEEQELIESFEE